MPTTRQKLTREKLLLKVRINFIYGWVLKMNRCLQTGDTKGGREIGEIIEARLNEIDKDINFKGHPYSYATPKKAH